VYRLDSSEARKNAEYAGGIARLLAARSELPDFIRPYTDVVDALSDGAQLTCYPGSPWLAAELLRDLDRLRLFEMHPQDVQALSDNFQRDRRVLIAASDGFAGLKALLPPPPRRAVVLVDPPYELKEDYDRVVDTLQDALKRFHNGTYMLWYPLLPRAEAQHLPEKLMALPVHALRIELRIENPRGEFGMYGSGLFVVNPPWLLRGQLEVWLPLLQRLLGRDIEASIVLEEIGAK
jgi:23S rRNA (adenine2030-N6)-methyltransferase